MTSPDRSDIRHDAATGRFEVHVDGEVAHVDYRLQDQVMRIVHTEVPVALEGRGLAGRMVRGALEHARGHGLAVLPQCSYVREYMRRHPETQDLLPVGTTL